MISPAARTRHQVFGLDVIRALAVLLVMASHCEAIFAHWLGRRDNWLIGVGAYYGIELFYVLSGLLIGTLLLHEVDQPDLSRTRVHRWWIFMCRRWLRTLPAYYVCLAVLLAVWAPIIGLAGPRAWRVGAQFALMLQNFAWPMAQGNFFDVTWSLAVEEWFYLGFAGLLFLLSRFVSASRAYWLAAAPLLIGPPLARLFLPALDPRYHEVIFWLDCIGIGVAAAFVARRYPLWFARAAWLLPIALVLTVLTLFGGLAHLGPGQVWQRSFGFALVAFALALLLPAAARWKSAHGPLAALIRVIARLSYCLYLTHLSVLIFIDYKRAAWHLSPGSCIALSLAAIAVLSISLSYGVERPLMARRPH
jgi:peptidoglycan/LPS O-acetylase OafA/YrhL